MPIIKKKDIFSYKPSKKAIIKESEDIDYLEEYDKQPAEVKALLDKYVGDEQDVGYSKLKSLKKELSKIGWDMDYGLDGSITELQPSKDEIEELVNPDGSPIEGDSNENKYQVKTGPPVTTKDHEDNTMQHKWPPYHGGRAYAYHTRMISSSYKREKQPITEDKIKSIIEDIISKRFSNQELVTSDEKIDNKIDKFVNSLKRNSDDIDIEEILNKIKLKLNGE